MEPLLVAGLILLGTLAAAALGYRLQTRFAKTEDGSAPSSGGSALGLAATLTAVVLGIVTASAAAECDQANNAVTAMAQDAGELGNLLDSYGPEAAPIRDQLEGVLRSLHERLDGSTSDAGAVPGSAAASPTESIYAAVAKLKPTTELQTELRNRALDLISDPDSVRERWAFTLGGCDGRVWA